MRTGTPSIQLLASAIALLVILPLQVFGAEREETDQHPAAESRREAPITYAELGKAGFRKPRWQSLKDDERAAFFKAYPADEEMLKRMKLGLQSQDLKECISGEPPSIQEGLKKFPLHYPMLGRMKRVTGVFEWKGRKQLLFRTEQQLYHVDEYHLLYRLSQLGFTSKSESRKATIDAVWLVNRIDGLRLVYARKIDLLDPA